MRATDLLQDLRASSNVKAAVPLGSAGALALRRLAYRVFRSSTDLRWRFGQRILGGGSASTRLVRSEAFEGVFEFPLRSDVARTVAANRFETRLARLMKSVVDSKDDIVDVGANVGLYAVLLAKHANAGRVLAIEPLGDCIRLLKANVARNGLDNVEIFHGAAAAAKATQTLTVIEGKEEYSSLGGIHHPAVNGLPKKTCSINTETVDALVDQHGLAPKVLKIDVEGAEGLVLAGSAQVLKKNRPLIISEIDDRLLPSLGSSPQEIVELLLSNDYEVFDLYGNRSLKCAEVAAGLVGEIVAFPK